MAIEANLVKFTLPAAAAITKFRFVDLNTSGQVAVLASANADAIAVCQNTPAAAGDPAELAMLGNGSVIKVEAGAAITAGAKVATDNVGRAVAATGTGTHVLGQVIEAATAAGQIVSMVAVSNHILA